MSVWGDVSDALISVLRAAGLTVHDAVPVTGDYDPVAVLVGATAADDSGLAGTIRQEWHDSGSGSRRDEYGEISCTVLAQSGDDDLAATRSALFTALGTVSTTIRNNYALGVSQVTYSEIEFGDIRQGHTQHGVIAEADFTITYKALI